MRKHPPPISGGYWRRLKKKESKGFTLVELIVVIVILAILAAILIPGMLKWIDQAKDKKYELEAREIVLAAQAAAAKVYADGSLMPVAIEADYRISWPLSEDGESWICNWMKVPALKREIDKLTNAEVKELETCAKYDPDASVFDDNCWKLANVEIWFVSSDGVKIYAENMSDHHCYSTDGWVITKNPGYWDDKENHNWDW